jgi:hypothetical protein
MGFPEEDRGMNLKQTCIVKQFAVIITIATLTLVAFGLMQSSVRIAGRGVVKSVGVGVFWDSNCTITVDFIDWGIVEPGSMNNVTVYVRNEGNVAANLSLATDNWTPSNASDYISLGWNYANQTLNPFDVVQVTLTLTISLGIEGIDSFSFDIIISASG